MYAKFKIISLVFTISIFSTPLCQQPDQQKLKADLSKWLKTSILQLKEINGGLTNSSFVATTQNAKFILRIGKQNSEILGIDRFCEDACQRSASNLGIAPKILYSNPSNGTLVSSFVNGKTLSEENEVSKDQLKKIVNLIKKIHKTRFKNSFKNTSIYEKIRKMISTSKNCKESCFSSKDCIFAENIIYKIENHFQKKEKLYEGLCHCDLFPRNFIDDGAQLWLIDWEYACWGNILFDIASLCTEFKLNEAKTNYVLKAYFGRKWKKHHQDLKLMQAVFNIRNAFWYDIRSKDIPYIGNVNMKDYANKHFSLFKKEIENCKILN